MDLEESIRIWSEQQMIQKLHITAYTAHTLRLARGQQHAVTPYIESNHNQTTFTQSQIQYACDKFIDLIRKRAKVGYATVNKHWLDYKFYGVPINQFDLKQCQKNETAEKRKQRQRNRKKPKQTNKRKNTESSTRPKKRRKTNIHPDLDPNQINYLKEFDAAKNGPLHQQSWIKENIADFHKKQKQYELVQCQQCKDRWYSNNEFC